MTNAPRETDSLPAITTDHTVSGQPKELGWFGRTARSLRTGARTALELVKALWNGPYWWLVPVAALLLPTAILFVFLQAMPLVAPFVYTVL